MLQDLVIGGVGLAPLIIGLVAFAKRAGMPPEYAPWLNGTLAMIGIILVTYVVPVYPGINQALAISAKAVMTFLAASGTYQISKTSRFGGVKK